MTSSEEGTTGSPGRRSFMSWLVRGFLSLWGLGAAGVGIAFLKAPEAEKRPSEGLVKCGSFSALAVGEARFIRHGSTPIFVLRASETEVLALPAICTHMRCILKWNQAAGQFHCPCHQGAFDRNGNVLHGPPNRALAPYPAEIQADEIVVRT